MEADPQTDKSGPQASMDKRDLAVDQSTHEDIVAVTDGSRHREDLVTFWMRPPAPSNGLSRCDFSKRWHGPTRGLEHDAVPVEESQGPARSHQWTRSGGVSNFTSRWWASVLRHKSVARCSSPVASPRDMPRSSARSAPVVLPSGSARWVSLDQSTWDGYAGLSPIAQPGCVGGAILDRSAFPRRGDRVRGSRVSGGDT